MSLQVVYPGRPLPWTLLDTTGAFLLDDGVDLYVWYGNGASRLVRSCADKMSLELAAMVPRPAHGAILHVCEVGRRQGKPAGPEWERERKCVYIYVCVQEREFFGEG